jgi:membrane dipeptidase
MVKNGLREQALALLDGTRPWDPVIPWEPEIGNDVSLLHRWADAGYGFVSWHPAGDRHDIRTGLLRVAACRRAVDAAPGCSIVTTVDEILAANEAGQLAVGLHLEGSNCFEQDLDAVYLYWLAGVRFVHPVFNVANPVGGGCADTKQSGLTEFGRRLIREFDELGIVPDGAHGGRRMTLEMAEVTGGPMVFSHVGCDRLHPHIKNVTDEQIRACADTGGVIGVTGANNYLGASTASRIVDHMEHIAGLVGPEHVALGLDYVDDAAFLDRYVAEHIDEWPGTWAPWSFSQPSAITNVVAELLERGFSASDVEGILQRNWRRVAEQTWT